jgi:hypothetical protein
MGLHLNQSAVELRPSYSGARLSVSHGMFANVPERADPLSPLGRDRYNHFRRTGGGQIKRLFNSRF